MTKKLFKVLIALILILQIALPYGTAIVHAEDDFVSTNDEKNQINFQIGIKNAKN